MKKLSFIAVMLACAVATVFGQEYKARPPKAAETRRVAGLDWYIKDGPRYQILQRFLGEGENVVLNDTNTILICRSSGALTNAVIVFPNPTNYPGRVFEVVALGNISLTLTNAPVSTFTSSTNGTFSTYVMPTNSTAMVYSATTNWVVISGFK